MRHEAERPNNTTKRQGISPKRNVAAPKSESHERDRIKSAIDSLPMCDTDEKRRKQGDDLEQPPRKRVYKGVSHEKKKCLWRARLYIKGNHITIGRFQTDDLAARAYDRAAVFVYGRHAVTNLGVTAAEIDVNLHPLAPCLANKLRVLREAVVRDQQSCVQPSQRYAREVRHAAASAAFSESGPYPWPWTRLSGLNSSQSCGAGDSRSQSLRAFKVLVLAAFRSQQAEWTLNA